MADYSVLNLVDGSMSVVRVIGLEVRLRVPQYGLLEELALIPSDIRIPLDRSGPLYRNNRYFNITMHTSVGDVNFQEARCPF